MSTAEQSAELGPAPPVGAGKPGWDADSLSLMLRALGTRGELSEKLLTD